MPFEFEMASQTIGGEENPGSRKRGDVQRALDSVQESTIQSQCLSNVADEATVAFEVVTRGTAFHSVTERCEAA